MNMVEHFENTDKKKKLKYNSTTQLLSVSSCLVIIVPGLCVCMCAYSLKLLLGHIIHTNLCVYVPALKKKDQAISVTFLLTLNTLTGNLFQWL